MAGSCGLPRGRHSSVAPPRRNKRAAVPPSWGSPPSSASCQCRPWCLKGSPPTWEILAPGSTSNQGPWGHLRSEPAGRSFCLSNQGREKRLNDMTQNSNKHCGTAPLGGSPPPRRPRNIGWCWDQPPPPQAHGSRSGSRSGSVADGLLWSRQSPLGQGVCHQEALAGGSPRAFS